MGNRLSPDSSKETDRGKLASGLAFGTSNMVGRRSKMEDSHCVESLNDEHSLFGVFDGHGGSYAARFVATELVNVLQRQVEYGRYLKALESSEAQSVRILEEALKDAFLELDRQLFLLVLEKKETIVDKRVRAKMDAGATACVVVVTPTHIVCANAGDSRAFLARGDTVVELSEDHKPNNRTEEDRIKAAGGYVFGGRLDDDLLVSRGFGDYRMKDRETSMHGTNHTTGMTQRDQKVSPLPEVKSVRRNPVKDQYIIVACDGIYDVFSNKKAKATIDSIYQSGETDAGMVCEELLDMALIAGSKDNMSAIVVELEGLVVGEGMGVVGRRAAREPKASKRKTSSKP